MNLRTGFSLPSLTIFIGSFLIFGVQPMLGRTLLPAFGGTSAVWTTCLATYQVLLLVGYFYAHRMSIEKCANAGMRECANGEEHPPSQCLRRTGRTSNIERSTSNAQRLPVRRSFSEGGTSNEDNKAIRQSGSLERSGNHSANAESVSGNKAMHIALLAVAVAWVAGFAWGRPWLMAHIGNSGCPALEVLLCVLAFAGLPYVLLSANSTLIQAWLSQAEDLGRGTCDLGDGEDPMSHVPRPMSDVYALYAVSNAGSLLGLLCYPFLVEPFLSLDAQWYGFAGCLAVYGGLLAILARGMRECSNAGMRECGEEKCANARMRECENGKRLTLNAQRLTSNEGTARSENVALPRSGGACEAGRAGLSEHAAENVALPSQSIHAFEHSRIRAFLWLALPATSTFLLNAVTAHLSTDVTPIPLLWVALLAAFLLSYIIGFSKIGEKGVLVWCVVAMVPLVFCAYGLGLKGGRGFLSNLIPGILLVLLGSTFLHSWLYSIRPEAERLTRFYLCIAAGGAVGGLLSGIIAPLVFNRVMEYPLVLVFLGIVGALYARNNAPKEFRWLETATPLVALTTIILTASGVYKGQQNVTVRMTCRSFYGCLKVSDTENKTSFGDSLIIREFQHGDTVHGAQLQPHYLREKPTTYFGPYGGGLGIMGHHNYSNNSPMSVGIIGLGIGTLAAYGRTNDMYRFFEINPQVVSTAWNTNYFTYLSGCKANISIALGDARKMLCAETNRYDVFVVDAYSGDSIPFHLATKEAFRLYLDRLNPGGTLAVHISNWHIDLNPLCKAVAKEFGLQLTGVISQPQGICTGANWVFISDRQIPLEGLPVRETDWSQVRDIALPTDAKGSLLNLVRYGHRPPEKPLEIDLSKIF